MDVAILTIIPEEFHAVQSVLETATDLPHTEKPNTYSWKRGTIGRYSVVVGLVGKAGTTPCALATLEAHATFKPESIVLLGVAGGMPKEGQKSGDVAVSDAIWFYDYGKVEDGFNPRLRYVYQTDPILLRSAMSLRPPPEIWFPRPVTPAQDESEPKVRCGLIASGNKVVDNIDDPIFRRVLAVEPKILAVEMEGAGAADAVDELKSRGASVRFIMIRGISDMPNIGVAQPGTQTTQRDQNKVVAATAAARFLKFWLETGWPIAPLQTNARSVGNRRKEVRSMLQARLQNDDMFMQFCIEHFPKIASSFSSGMTLISKQNYLFMSISADEIERELVRFQMDES